MVLHSLQGAGLLPARSQRCTVRPHSSLMTGLGQRSHRQCLDDGPWQSGHGRLDQSGSCSGHDMQTGWKLPRCHRQSDGQIAYGPGGVASCVPLVLCLRFLQLRACGRSGVLTCQCRQRKPQIEDLQKPAHLRHALLGQRSVCHYANWTWLLPTTVGARGLKLESSRAPSNGFNIVSSCKWLTPWPQVPMNLLLGPLAKGQIKNIYTCSRWLLVVAGPSGLVGYPSIFTSYSGSPSI
jgi:hypothetical protein